MTLRAKTTFAEFLTVLFHKATNNYIGKAFLLLPLIYVLIQKYSTNHGLDAIDIQPYALQGMAFLATILILFMLAAQQLFRKLPQFRETVVYSFGEEGVFVRGDSFETILSWSHLQKLEETRVSFVLTHSDLNWFVIPKRQIGDQLSELRNLTLSKSVMQNEMAEY